jgi:hypothetical protein
MTCSTSNDGEITASFTGGTSTKTYAWQKSANGTTGWASHGGNTTVISSLGVGYYRVTITDANGCASTSGNIHIVAPSAVTISSANVTSNYNGAQLSCATSADGQITVNASGGTGQLQYAINNGTFQTSPVFSGLAAGTYAVAVKDVNNCSASTSTTITAPAAVTVASVSKKTYNGVELSCATSTDGQLTVTGNGGVTPYSYSLSWSSGSRPYQTSNVFSGLPAGTFTVLVKDANSCVSPAFTSTISAPPALNATPSVTSNYNGSQLTCPTSTDGSVTVSTTGGTGSYSYIWEKSSGSWTTVGNTQSVTGLGAGTYRVTVTDINSCAVTKQIEIVPPAATLIVSTSKKAYTGGANVSCVGAVDGEITVTATGGTGSLQYSNNNGSTWQTSNVFTGLAAGSYMMVVKDANVCPSAPVQVVLTSPSAVVVSSFSNDSPKNAGSTVTFTASVSGGVQNNTGSKYTYQWSVPNGGKTPTLSGESGSGTITATFTITSSTAAENGTYTLTVKDANNCSISASKQVIVYPSTLFVTTNGNDATGDGRESNPLKTIQKAITVALAGNTIEVKSGQFDESPVVSKSLTINGTSTTTLGSGRYFIYGTTEPITWGTNWPSSVWDNVGVNADGTILTAYNKVNGGSSSTLWVIGSHNMPGLTVSKQLAIRGATANAAVPTYVGCDIAPTAILTHTPASSSDVNLFTMTGSATKTLRDLELRIPNASFFVEVANGSSGDVTTTENMVYKWVNNAASPGTYRRMFGMVNGSFSGGTERFDIAKLINDGNESASGFGSGKVIYGNNGPLPWNDVVVAWKSEDGESATNLGRIRNLHDAKTDVTLQSGLLTTPRPTLYTTDALFNNKYFLGFAGNQYLEVNTNADMNGGNEKTLFLVFAPVDGTADQVIYKHGNNQKGMSLVQLADGKISLNIYNDTDDTPAAATHESWIFNAPADNTVLIAQIYFDGNSTAVTGHRIGASLDQSSGRLFEINHGTDTTGWLTDAAFSSTTLQTPAIDGGSVVSLGARSGGYYYGSWDGTAVAHNYSNATFGRGNFFKGKFAEAVMISTADETQRDAVYCYLRNKYFSADQNVGNYLNKDGDVIAGEAATLEAEIAAYPNPASAELQVEVAVPIAGPLTIVIKDALGRTVQTIFEGVVEANTVVPVSANVSQIQSGAYFICASGAGDLNVATPLMIRR